MECARDQQTAHVVHVVEVFLRVCGSAFASVVLACVCSHERVLSQRVFWQECAGMCFRNRVFAQASVCVCVFVSA